MSMESWCHLSISSGFGQFGVMCQCQIGMETWCHLSMSSGFGKFGSCASVMWVWKVGVMSVSCEYRKLVSVSSDDRFHLHFN